MTHQQLHGLLTLEALLVACLHSVIDALRAQHVVQGQLQQKAQGNTCLNIAPSKARGALSTYTPFHQATPLCTHLQHVHRIHHGLGHTMLSPTRRGRPLSQCLAMWLAQHQQQQ